jgi:ankyrin repeat protein
MLAAGAPVDYEAGASLVPLAPAVMQRHTQMVHYLIEPLDAGADVRYKNSAGLTALHCLLARPAASAEAV